MPKDFEAVTMVKPRGLRSLASHSAASRAFDPSPAGRPPPPSARLLSGTRELRLPPPTSRVPFFSQRPYTGGKEPPCRN
jgi:hypothetical protein